MTGKTKVSSRERLFCQNYVRMGNVREAAARSGYPIFPEKNGLRLVNQERIQEEIMHIRRWNRQRPAHSKTAAGYERLAYGGISDAVRLLFADEVSAEELEIMDLFNVAEIKRPRGGGMEIKFFDRLKALEKLQQISGGDEEEKAAFLNALEQGALAVNGEKAGDGHGV